MAAHTPGPWKWDGKFTVEIPHATGMACFRTMPEDARLIAAAPELLAMVKKLRYVVHTLGIDPVDNDYVSVLEQADLAIAKAEGD